MDYASLEIMQFIPIFPDYENHLYCDTNHNHPSKKLPTTNGVKSEIRPDQRGVL
jgi:hypothetical protein